MLNGKRRCFLQKVPRGPFSPDAMAQDSFTTYNNPLKSLGNSLFGMLLAPVFIIGSAVLLFYNESHAVREADSLTAGAANVVEADAAKVDTSREGKLVHLSGDAQPAGELYDPDFGVGAVGVKLKRTVEVYEWTESKSTKDNRTTYNYEKKWQDHLVESGHFEHPQDHANPTRLAFPGKTFQAESVSVGAFQLAPELVDEIGGEQPLPLKTDAVKVPAGAKVQENTIYVGKDPANPVVGDLRITEKLTPGGPVSVVAAQQGSKLGSYQSKNGAHIALLELGTRSAAQMFQTAQSANAVLTWILRAVAFVVLFIGIHAIFGPLSAMASYVPILGAVFEGGVFIVSFLLALIGWFVLVGAAWVTARPFIAIPLLILAVLAVVSLVWLLLKRHAARKARLAGGMPVPA